MTQGNTSEVLIIGGGIIGLSIARELHKQGVKRIILVEKGVCGAESSWAAAGMLGPQAATDEGGLFFEMLSASRDLYPEFAAELLAETGVDIELDRTGVIYLAFTENEVLEIRKRFEWQKQQGLEVESLSADDVRSEEPFVSPNVLEALYFAKDWQVENRKLLAALRHYAETKGIQIVENTPVESLIFENGRVVGAVTKNGQITADRTILATGAWTSLITIGQLEMPFKIEPVRGQMIVFHPSERLFRHVIYSKRGYLVPRVDGRVLAGSTTENVNFDRSLTESAANELRDVASEMAPGIAKLVISDHWSGLRPCSSDGMPIIGSINGIEDLFIATGHYRNGILLAPLTAKLTAANLVNGEHSDYFEVFGPDRFRPHSVATVI